MPNQTIISMQLSYPFGSYPLPNSQNNQVMVRKQINTENKHEIISKAKNFKKLNIPNSIHIISIFQNVQYVQIYFEYIPVKFEIWMKNVSDFLSHNLQKQLYHLVTFLAQNRISTSFNPDNLGLDKNYHIKYFIDLQNTFYSETYNPSTLKQKYYREVNLFIKSFNEEKDKDRSYPKPLFSSLNNIKLEPQGQSHSTVRSFPRNFGRVVSFGSLEEDQLFFVNRTVNTYPDIPQKSKNAEQNKSKKQQAIIQFNQKLKNIKQKLETVKEKGPKVFFQSMELQRKNNVPHDSAKKAPNSKKLVQQNQLNKEASIDKLIDREQKGEKLAKNKQERVSESEINALQEKSFFFRPSSKESNSKKFKSQKSDSPVEYMDFVKSTSEYVHDFLNVLEDSSQSDQQNCFEESKKVDLKFLKPQTGPKRLLKTQESQNSNQSEQQKWRMRFDTAIMNSKKLIDKMRSPPKPIRLSENFEGR